MTVERFDQKKAKECDVVFLAVSGDFSLEHAKALTEGDDACICIDNSVSTRWSLVLCLLLKTVHKLTVYGIGPNPNSRPFGTNTMSL